MSNWLKLEMFEDTETTANKIVPTIIVDNGKLSKTWAHYKSKDYASSANMLRQASEKLCKEYLILQEQLGFDYRQLGLDALLNKLIIKLQEGVTNSLLVDLSVYKNSIMNPNSHHDIEYPLLKWN